jgi:hypothetical protein
MAARCKALTEKDLFFSGEFNFEAYFNFEDGRKSMRKLLLLCH